MDTRYYHVSLDSLDDLSAATLELSLTGDTWTDAEHTTPPASAATLPAPEDGFRRYWWRALLGPGQTLDPTGLPEPITLRGRLATSPEVLYPSWVVGTADTDAPPALSDECWPVIIPPGASVEWNAVDGGVRAYAEALAVATLRTLTAYTIGGCPITVRPFRGGCRRFPTWRTFPVVGGGEFGESFYPVLASGSWLNLGCGDDGCGVCLPRTGLRLPGGAAGGITALTVDGVTLDPSAYYLRGEYLHRTDGTPFPVTPGSVEVTYYPNPRPDGLGALAAGALAVEYARAATGNKNCRLPSRAVSVTRNNVSVQLASPTDLYPQGLTGVMEADLFIRRINPNRLTSRPTVWSPDLPAYRS